MELQVDNQVVATAETRTPNLHRAKISLSRVRMEGWRQWRLGRRKTLSNKKQNGSSWLRPAFSWKGISLIDPSCNGEFSVRREKALVHSGKERPARELDRSTR
jgi:hypothetical protein